MMSKEIVLVEDDADTRMLYDAFLSLLGARVHAFEDVENALSFCESAPSVDLIVLDKNVPSGGAGAFVAGLRTRVRAGASAGAYMRGALPKLVLVTGDSEISKVADELAVDAYLQKPIRLDMFERVIRDLL